MTDLPIWAQDRAREWLESLGGRLEGPGPIGEAYGWLEVSDESAASLAALLVDVAAVGKMVTAENAEYLSTLRADVLAEVRRVVEEVRGSRIEGHCFKCVRRAGDEILARIEKL